MTVIFVPVYLTEYGPLSTTNPTVLTNIASQSQGLLLQKLDRDLGGWSLQTLYEQAPEGHPQGRPLLPKALPSQEGHTMS